VQHPLTRCTLPQFCLPRNQQPVALRSHTRLHLRRGVPCFAASHKVLWARGLHPVAFYKYSYAIDTAALLRRGHPCKGGMHACGTGKRQRQHPRRGVIHHLQYYFIELFGSTWCCIFAHQSPVLHKKCGNTKSKQLKLLTSL